MKSLDRTGGAFGQLYGVGDKAKVIVKDTEFGRRIGKIIMFTREGVILKFTCGSNKAFSFNEIQKEA